jgi:hypothetical protein
MAATIIEDKQTRALNYATGRTTATRRFHVYDDASPLLTPASVRDLFGTGSMPQIGDIFPGETDIYAVSYTIDLVPESSSVWAVTWNYESTEPGSKQPQEVGYTEFTIDYKVEFRDFWRAAPNLSIPTNGTPNNDNINGTPIDAAGVPRSVLVHLSTIDIAETVASTSVPERSLTVRAARGTRNASAFYGAPKGQVLYMGASARRISLDKYTISHRFAQDEYSHLVQVAQRNQEGEPILERINGILRAKPVMWIQPFPNFTDFNQISENF